MALFAASPSPSPTPAPSATPTPSPTRAPPPRCNASHVEAAASSRVGSDAARMHGRAHTLRCFHAEWSTLRVRANARVSACASAWVCVCVCACVCTLPQMRVAVSVLGLARHPSCCLAHCAPCSHAHHARTYARADNGDAHSRADRIDRHRRRRHPERLVRRKPELAPPHVAAAQHNAHSACTRTHMHART